MRFVSGSEVWQRSRPVAIPLLLMAVVATVDIGSPPDVHLGPLLIVAPAVTVTAARPRLTAAVGALAVVAQVMIGVERDALYTLNIWMQSTALAVISGFLVVYCNLIQRSTRELARVRTVSEAAQRVVLRPLPERIGPLRIASCYQAADDEAHVGGDLYAAARMPHGTRLLIGDVRGKGLGSISDTALLLGAFRAAAHRQAPLPELVAYLEGSVSWGLAEFPQGDQDVGERFVTATVVDIPDDQPLIHMISCGHPPPLKLHQGKATALQVSHPSPPLGLGGLSEASYEPATFDFEQRDLLLLYTDGVTEARDRHGDFYPLAERVGTWAAVDSPAALVRKVAADLLVHVGAPLDDDVALIAVERVHPTWTGPVT
ncbi:PP2C family protein-serine/threonine phosphatase [Streptomyces sp. NPDC002537]